MLFSGDYAPALRSKRATRQAGTLRKRGVGRLAYPAQSSISAATRAEASKFLFTAENLIWQALGTNSGLPAVARTDIAVPHNELQKGAFQCVVLRYGEGEVETRLADGAASHLTW